MNNEVKLKKIHKPFFFKYLYKSKNIYVKSSKNPMQNEECDNNKKRL